MKRTLFVVMTALWTVPAAALAPLAPTLASRSAPTHPNAWHPTSVADAWRAVTAAGPAGRQSARWTYARALIGEGRGAEALGVLDTMVADEPALVRSDFFALARGAALLQLRRAPEAVEALASPGLAANPEACFWRLLALEADGQATDALRQLACARSALAARQAPSRRGFILAASRAALAASQAQHALDWLRQLPAGDSSANLVRGQALYALGRGGDADRLMTAVAQAGTPGERVEARLGQIESGIARRTIPAHAAWREVERLRYGWRGDRVEERALMLSYRLSSARGDLRAALSAGSTLFNYFDARADRSAFIAALQRQLAATLDPANGLPLDQAAGLYWDFRALAPVGAEGDLLVARLAARLEEAGLYARAAELLEHQLVVRARDLAKGPLSARVAALHILAGHPQQALAAIRASERPDYPAAMRQERQRVEAVALIHLERDDEALAVLDSIPDGAALRAEIHWRRREWSIIAATTRAALPPARALGEVEQVVVLRHAVALAMLGQEEALRRLRTRYAAAFAGLPTAAAFEVLTGTVGSLDAAAMVEALSAIPAASPAGAFGDLLDAVPAT